MWSPHHSFRCAAIKEQAISSISEEQACSVVLAMEFLLLLVA
jgi:hypothetical protein